MRCFCRLLAAMGWVTAARCQPPGPPCKYGDVDFSALDLPTGHAVKVPQGTLHLNPCTSVSQCSTVSDPTSSSCCLLTNFSRTPTIVSCGAANTHKWTTNLDDPNLRIGMIQTRGSQCGYVLEPAARMQVSISFECDEREPDPGKLAYVDSGTYCNLNLIWKTKSACKMRLAPNRPRPSSPANIFGMVVAAVGVVAVLIAACAICFSWVLHWSKQPTRNPVLGIAIEDSAASLIKQLVGVVGIRIMWSMFAIAMSTIGLMESAGSDVAIVDWVVSLPFALCIPACGYCGAKERHRFTLGLFVACNLASAIWSTVALFWSQPPAATSVNASPIENAAATTFAVVLQVVSIAISLVNAVAGYRLWDHSFMRAGLDAPLIQAQPAVHIVAPTHPVIQSTSVNASVGVSAAGVAADPHSSSVRPRPVHTPTHSWTVEQLSQWLASDLGLSELSVAASHHQIDGPTAAEMGSNAWQELGATAIQTARIIAAFKRIGTFVGAE